VPPNDPNEIAESDFSLGVSASATPVPCSVDFETFLNSELIKFSRRLKLAHVAELSKHDVHQDQLQAKVADLGPEDVDLRKAAAMMPQDPQSIDVTSCVNGFTMSRYEKSRHDSQHASASDSEKSITPMVHATPTTEAGFVKGEGHNHDGVELVLPSRIAQSQSVESSVLDDIVLQRLQVRLGKVSQKCMVTGKDLYSAVSSLGLEKYSVETMEVLVHSLKLSYNAEPVQKLKKARTMLSFVSSGAPEDEFPNTAIPLKDLIQIFQAGDIRQRLGSEVEEQIFAVREVLLTGDTNRLVAELTNVRVDDLATPPPKPDRELLVMEPLVCFVIIINGVLIGMQTDPKFESWAGWVWTEACTVLFFVLEAILRVRFRGIARYFCGVDCWWNLFDAIIILLALGDIIMTVLAETSGTQSLTVLRLLRLTRLSRLIRFFRLGFMQELQLMMKGLLSGFRTLIWAFVLLLFVIYVFAVFLTTTIGRADENIVHKEGIFSSVPIAMFTTFRCFVGDCITSEGHPIAKLLFDAHGWLFVFGYVVSFMVVTFGIFNVIIAIYVEITMNAAKRNEEMDKNRRDREAIRVAHITKQLVKMFCSAHRNLSHCPMSSRDMDAVLSHTGDEEIDEDALISKELFLLVVQDRKVQKLLDNLDVPSDRAHLFDIIDADGSGGLHLSELVQGLLKVRGEARKSDMVASLLAVRAVQDMLREFEQAVLPNQHRIMDHLGIQHSFASTPSARRSCATPPRQTSP